MFDASDFFFSNIEQIFFFVTVCVFGSAVASWQCSKKFDPKLYALHKWICVANSLVG